MRGALADLVSWKHTSRIIPADAGSTSDSASGGAWLADHPRGCGEHSLTTAMTSSYLGSSPRMRGAHVEDT